jgi:flagellar FliJ protein
MGYAFKLEALRRFRYHQEEVHQRAFADAQRMVEQAQKQLNDQFLLKKQTELEFQKLQNDLITGPRAGIYRSYLNQLAEHIRQCQEKLADCQKDLEQARKVLLDAMKKRKAIDKLKENEFHAYLEQLNREEVKFIDEMAINRHTLYQR